jgi:pimeloyl-ACP methyl ester carboxylesterase
MRFATALTAMTLATWGTGVAQQHLSAGYPPPGRLIEIGGRKLHLHCSGQGTPTVILVAGGGAFSIDWTLVQPRVASTTRVCSYDRAGLGWSDPGPAEETVEETIKDLHLLLRAAGETGRYVLVGASIGGIYIRAYQHAFPNEVAGLIFANSSHRVGMYVKGNTDLIWKLSEDELRSAYPLPPDAKGEAPTHEGDPFDRLPVDVQAVRLWLDRRLWDKWDPARTGPESMLSWRKEFLRELQESCSESEHPLRDLPVLILSSDSSASELARLHRLDHAFCDRSDAGDGLELLSSNSMYVMATGSGHEIHLYQPDVVVRGVERVVGALRERVPLAQTRSAP